MENEIFENGFELTRIVNESDFKNQLERNQLVVIDGYNFDTEYMKSIKNNGPKLAVIDDFCDKNYFADIIINASPAAEKSKYIALPHTRFALGLDYALLRKRFIYLSTKPRKINKINTVLVCFGGADKQNLTLKVITELKKLNGLSKIIAVVGSVNSFYDHIMHLSCTDNRIVVKQNFNEEQMTSVLLEADVTVTSASGIALEAICCGCIPVIGITAKNQIHFHDALRDKYSIQSFGNNINRFEAEKLRKCLESISLKAPSNTNEIRSKISKSVINIRTLFLSLSNDKIY